jgi:hypothetical protein
VLNNILCIGGCEFSYCKIFLIRWTPHLVSCRIRQRPYFTWEECNQHILWSWTLCRYWDFISCCCSCFWPNQGIMLCFFFSLGDLVASTLSLKYHSFLEGFKYWTCSLSPSTVPLEVSTVVSCMMRLRLSSLHQVLHHGEIPLTKKEETKCPFWILCTSRSQGYYNHPRKRQAHSGQDS